MSISSEYNGNILSAEQIDLLHAGLEADVAEMADEAELEAGA